MKKIKLAAGLLACIMTCSPLMHQAAAMNASAINLHDEATMTEEEKQIKEYCDTIINLVNNERTSCGLSELATFPLLNEVTCLRAEELVQSFGHMRPDGSMCFSAMKQAGITYKGAAENIAAGRPEPSSAMEQWMNSEGHRNNILDPNKTHIGIGYCYDEDSVFGYHWSMFLITSLDGGQPHVFDGQYIPSRDFGDPDGNQEINAADAKLILHYSASRAAGLEIQAPTGFLDAADLNHDGSVDAVDASAILEYSAVRGTGVACKLSDFVW
ncbi:MAG: hypothetical protein IJJ69_08470 [Oscillospiraceae bacterium]|nr:hypothetical protein [Oscillospiraceae bacterium]